MGCKAASVAVEYEYYAVDMVRYGKLADGDYGDGYDLEVSVYY